MDANRKKTLTFTYLLLGTLLAAPTTAMSEKAVVIPLVSKTSGIKDFMCNTGEYVIGFKDNVPVCSQNTIPCKDAESDAESIAGDLADYFAVPSHTTLGTTPIIIGSAGGSPESGGEPDMDFSPLTGTNTARILGDVSDIIIDRNDE